MAIDDPAVLASALSGIGDSIVNPRCDECGTSLDTPTPRQIGMPRLCAGCSRRVGQMAATVRRDWESQERPRNRTVHVVKLPECMMVAPPREPPCEPEGNEE